MITPRQLVAFAICLIAIGLYVAIRLAYILQ
jgi:hypothetical protein